MGSLWKLLASASSAAAASRAFLFARFRADAESFGSSADMSEWEKKPEACTWFLHTCFGVRGGSRYVEGCWRFPCLRKPIGFLVFWFFGFLALVSWFLGFLVSWFLGLKGLGVLGFMVSWFQSFLASCFLISRFQSFFVSWFLGCKVSKLFGFKVPWFQKFQ